LTTAAHGTDLGTALSILNLLNNVHQLSNDIHQIPSVINQTLAAIINGTGQAGQVILQQLVGAVSNNAHNAASRNLLGSLGQNANLLSSITHLLPQGTSISTVISLLNLLNNVHQLSNDIHQIPAVLNQTLASIVNGSGQAAQDLLQQLVSLIGPKPTTRGLLDSLGQNVNLLSSITHLLPQGTSISTVLSILNLLNNVHQLNNDIHQIPALINETLGHILDGTDQAAQVIIQQLVNLVSAKPPSNRNILSSLGQNTNLLSSISHLLPQGTSISTVLSLLNLLNNVHALNNDLHQIPAVLQQTIQDILQNVQQHIPQTH
jgi:riboflavin transporter FmnP